MILKRSGSPFLIMVGVFSSTVLAAASSNQYDGSLSRHRPREADCARRERFRLTGTRSNGAKGMDDHFRRNTRIGNAPRLAPRDGHQVSPMSGERRMGLLAGLLLGNVER